MINKIDLEMLKSRMAKLDEIKASKKKIQDACDLEKAPFDTAQAKIEEEIGDLKLAIGTAAVDHFEKTKEKKQLGGVGIQEKNNTIMSYTQESALKWAKEKDMFLILDKKAFEKSAPDLHLPFVTIKTEKIPTATFPKEIKLED